MENEKSNGVGLARIVRAARCSLLGFKAAYTCEQAFRQELLLCVLLVPLGLWLGQSSMERALLVGSLLLILIVELLNSSIEAIVDRIGTEHHELSGRAKDIGSAAVFLSFVHAAVIWLLVLV